MAKIQRAILSVTDKTGLVEFARRLAALGVELISTGGTAGVLRQAGLPVRDISDLTGFPEMLDGRVKTLHPKVHGGILHLRSNPAHVAAIAAHGIAPIDMVVVNLYAFEKTAGKPGARFEEIVENIDIGGPSMVRSSTPASSPSRLTGPWRRRLLPPPPPMTPPSPTPSPKSRSMPPPTLTSAGLATAPAFPRSCASSSTRRAISVMAKTRIRKRRCTPTAAAWA
jgi:hypothetical protein